VKVIKSGPLSILGRERGPDLIPRRSPERPPEVGADITPVNCDRSETQCVGISELFGLLLLEHTRSLKVHAEYRVRAFSEPRNGRVADVVASADLDQRFPRLPSR
jgi:hypothetical protein